MGHFDELTYSRRVRRVVRLGRYLAEACRLPSRMNHCSSSLISSKSASPCRRRRSNCNAAIRNNGRHMAENVIRLDTDKGRVVRKLDEEPFNPKTNPKVIAVTLRIVKVAIR